MENDEIATAATEAPTNPTEKNEESQERLVLPIKLNIDANIGIHLSIFLTLLIFCGLLFLPARMLFDTSYEIANNNTDDDNSTEKTNFLSSMKFREKKLCPGLNYEYWLSSIFFSNYDRNCTYKRKRVVEKHTGKYVRVKEETKKMICAKEKKTSTMLDTRNDTIEETKTTRPKSVPVTGHILAMLLVVSAVAAFVEVLRIRFINPKDTSTVETAGSRQGSSVDLMYQGCFLSRGTITTQRSFDVQGMQRSAQRLSGIRPPPLTRRSSFPTYHLATMDLAAMNDAMNPRSISRRTSIVETIPDPGISSVHRRARMIRRH